MGDTMKNKIDKGVGKLKEAVGQATGNGELRREGGVQKNTAKVKEKVQDAVDKTKDAIDQARDSRKK